MKLRTLTITTLVCFGGSAWATPARVESLSANPGFVDDTDVLTYPSTISEVGDAVNLNYGATADGGVTWDSGRLVWFTRESASGANPSPIPTGPWSFVYGSGNGNTGWLARTSWQAGALSLGGVWGKGGWGREATNLAIGGDLTLIGPLLRADGEPETEYVVDIHARGRKLQDKKLMAWNAGLGYDTPTEALQLRGGLQMGPRFGGEGLEAALALGPGLVVTSGGSGAGAADAGGAGEAAAAAEDAAGGGGGSDATSLQIDVPVINLAAEYEVKPWLLLRGSAFAGWTLNAGDVGELTKTDAWSTAAGGMVGMGFRKGDKAQFDLSINPGWVVAGPFLLSGAATPMLATVSGRIAI